MSDGPRITRITANAEGRGARTPTSVALSVNELQAADVGVRAPNAVSLPIRADSRESRATLSPPQP